MTTNDNGDGDDRTKKRILARRAQLVAAAVSVACSPTPETKPSVCLEPIVLPPEDASAKPAGSSSDNNGVVPPTVCLSPMPPQLETDSGVAPQDSGVAAVKDAGVKDSGVKPIAPSVCLSPLPPPKVCLKPMPPPTVCLYVNKPPKRG